MTMTMTMTTVAFLSIAGSAALIRHFLACRLNASVPWGTLIANIVASGLLGLLAESNSQTAQTVLGVAGLGALSTWSTLANETVQLANRNKTLAGSYLTSSVLIGVGAAWLGLQIAALAI